MGWLANVPIRAKLLLISALASAIALLLAGAAIVAYDTITYTDQKKREISVQTETLAASVTAALAFNDVKVAEEYLKVRQCRTRNGPELGMPPWLPSGQVGRVL